MEGCRMTLEEELVNKMVDSKKMAKELDAITLNLLGEAGKPLYKAWARRAVALLGGKYSTYAHAEQRLKQEPGATLTTEEIALIERVETDPELRAIREHLDKLLVQISDAVYEAAAHHSADLIYEHVTQLFARRAEQDDSEPSS
jgi:hypothetical protein